MYISDELIEKLKIKISQPDGAFEPQEILDFAHQALVTEIVPELIKSRENYFVRVVEVSIAQGESEVRIPSRAYGGTVRELKLTDGSQTYQDLYRLSEEDFDAPLKAGKPRGFAIRGNRIVFDSQMDKAYTLRIAYWIFPSRLVPSAECAQITGIAGNVLSCAAPATWTTSDRFDVVLQNSDYEPLLIDQTAIGVTSGVSIELSSAPTGVSVGDWVCLAGESPYAYLQDAYYPVLMQYSVSNFHESKGDVEQKNASDAKAEALLKRLLGVYSERAQGAPVRIKSSLI